MVAGFFLAVMALVIVSVLFIQERLASHMRRSQHAEPPAATLSAWGPRPDSMPRPAILSVLAWATVAQAGLWGMAFAAVMWCGVGPTPRPPHAADLLSLAFYAVLCVGPVIGAYRRTRDLVALRPGGLHRAAGAVMSPLLAVVLVAVFVAARLLWVARAWMADTSGWTSPEAIQSYAWIGLLMALTILLTILSTLVTHGLQSDEVRRLFPEAQGLPQASASL